MMDFLTLIKTEIESRCKTASQALGVDYKKLLSFFTVDSKRVSESDAPQTTSETESVSDSTSVDKSSSGTCIHTLARSKDPARKNAECGKAVKKGSRYCAAHAKAHETKDSESVTDKPVKKPAVSRAKKNVENPEEAAVAIYNRHSLFRPSTDPRHKELGHLYLYKVTDDEGVEIEYVGVRRSVDQTNVVVGTLDSNGMPQKLKPHERAACAEVGWDVDDEEFEKMLSKNSTAKPIIPVEPKVASSDEEDLVETTPEVKDEAPTPKPVQPKLMIKPVVKPVEANTTPSVTATPKPTIKSMLPSLQPKTMQTQLKPLMPKPRPVATAPPQSDEE
jgi:hypothetical protein